jgi:hypothetical protein
VAVKTVDLKDFSKELKGFGEQTLKRQQQIVAQSLAKAIPRLVAASPVDTGLYAQSWDFSVDETSAILGNYAPHAAVIEYGARPFTPPLGPLLAWAKRVLRDPSQPPGYSPEVQELARGTQKKIQREGFQPKHILENELPNIIADIRKELGL